MDPPAVSRALTNSHSIQGRAKELKHNAGIEPEHLVGLLLVNNNNHPQDYWSRTAPPYQLETHSNQEEE